MKKRSDQALGKSLVPLGSSLPVNFTEQVRSDLEKTLRARLDTERKLQAANVSATRIILLGFLPVTLALTLPVGLLAVGLLAPAGFSLIGFLGIDEQKRLNNLGHSVLKDNESLIQEQFAQMQRDAYTLQKRQILQAAEDHLVSGALLSAEDAAWLGHLDPVILQDAGDQLAITALQARKLIAHVRDGIPETPLLFKDLKLDRNCEPHRAYLREKLLTADAPLAEDSLPEIQKAEVIPGNARRSGYLKALFNYVTPGSRRRLLREFENLQMPAVKDIEMPGIRPVEGFAAMLAEYESKNHPLDLPAVRGWKGPQRRMLPAPASVAGARLDGQRHRAMANGQSRPALDVARRCRRDQSHTETGGLLLEAGADVHAVNDRALRVAAEQGHTDIVRLLLEAEADINAENGEALRAAAEQGHTDIVRLLLGAGADINAENGEALRRAKEKGRLDVAQLLRAYEDSDGLVVEAPRSDSIKRIREQAARKPGYC